MTKRLLFILTILFITYCQLDAQSDSLFTKIDFELDFRFRIEQDWNSQKSDGTFRDDRTRLRYRLRSGATFENEWYSFGFRIRTGAQNKQQDPQLTLGKGLKEFGTLPIGFEKIFFQGKHKNFKYWLGKNSFSFKKNNELFWSDNVFPEGIYLEHSYKPNIQLLEKISLRGAHYILSSNGASFFDDAYFQGIQSSFHFSEGQFTLFPSIYLMRNIPNIPDGNHSFQFDYSIFHLGGKLKALKSSKFFIDFDLYQNFENYSANNNIPEDFQEQRTGYSIGVQYGNLKNIKDWKFKITYTTLQKYAALDYMAQNDWARWDYSSFDSPDGRLTNYRGIEIVAAYKLSNKVDLTAKYYNVNQLIPTGPFEETGQRIRLDLDVKI